VEIRRAGKADLEPMRALWEASNQEATFTPYPHPAFDTALLADHVALVAEDHDSPLGKVYVNMSNADFGYVFGLYVVPEARSRDIGRALMREVGRVLHDNGRAYIVLSVDTPNLPARAFYESLGFEEAARSLRTEVASLLPNG
jgi:ribosomal protein S18 acetylase RimI-like enzyme